ncbi:MAG: hypothetical protein ACYDB2_12170 [Acidimicrobiales bacterium]
MATNSFLFKGWAISIAAALSAFAAVDSKAALLFIALASTWMFWGLDGYYLWLERGFVELHIQVAKKGEEEIDFLMAINKDHAVKKWFCTCWRYHLCFFYGTIIAIDVVGIFIVRGK